MSAYITRRILLTIPTLFMVTILVFLSVRFIPGDVIDVMAGDLAYMGGPYVDREALERALGLDVPVYVQYGRWVGGIVLRGTLGDSLLGGFTVEEKILARLPVTLELGAMAIVIGFLIALPVGIYSAIRQDTATDYLGRSFAIIGLATPNFWLALMVMIFPAIWWSWSPPMQLIPFTEDPLGNLGMFLIPSLILGTASAAATMRMTRTMMLEVLRQDYIRTAWAKGLNERVVIMRHAVKNALIPVVTLIGMSLPLLIGGSVIIEQIFSLPGLGRLMLFALNERDYPGGLRSEPGFRHHGCGGQSNDRHDLSLFRPQGPLQLKYESPLSLHGLTGVGKFPLSLEGEGWGEGEIAHHLKSGGPLQQ